MFTIAKYKNRWAVLETKTGVYYFPEKSGKANAEKLAKKYNSIIGGR